MKIHRAVIVLVAVLISTMWTAAGKQDKGAAAATDGETPKSASRRYIHLPRPAANAVANRAPFSDGVLVGDTLYLAGRIGLDPQTGRPGNTPELEAKLALDGIQATLSQAGMTMDDLVFVQVYCSDVSLYEQWNAVYRRYFKGEFPARAFLGSGKLLFNARFEIQAIAVKR